MKTFLFITCIITFRIAVTAQSFCFNPPIISTPTNTNINTYNTVVSADFNKDGFIDVAKTEINDSISILLGTGNGSFLTPIFYHLSSRPTGLTVGDFNNDSNMDVAITLPDIDSISVFLGSVNGNLLNETKYEVGNYPVTIISDDFNNDNISDLVVVNNGSNNISSLLGIGNGTFNPQTTYPANNLPSYICKGDFNNDGSLDVAVSYVMGGISVFVNFGNGNFLVHSDYSIGGFGNNPIIANDINNDGNIDIVKGGLTGQALASDSVYVLIGGFFSNHKSYAVTGNARSLAVKDINNDGLVDIIAGDAYTSVLLGQGYATFGNSIHISSTPYSFSSLCVADFNNDMIPDVLGQTNYNEVCTFINGLPSFTITSNDTLCLSSNINVVGASTYLWNNGLTLQSISLTPTITTTFSIVATNTIMGCSSIQTIEVVVDNTCQDVWPGDANSDGIVDNMDILELGLHYTQTGTVRTTTNNTWQAYHATNWTGTITNGKNLNHSDCNGDGIINNNDTIAIYNNYGLTHAFKLSQVQSTNPALNIIADQSSINKGAWGTASIYLGDVTTTINNVNGVAYTLNYDNSFIEQDSVYLTYQNSFIDAGQNLRFRKTNFTTGTLYTASTHTNNTNVSGYGKIATLHYKIRPDLATDAPLNLSISQAVTSNASGSITPISSGASSVMAISASVGFQNYAFYENQIMMYPNPTKEIFHIEISSDFVINETSQLIIYNALGQITMVVPVTNKSTIVNSSSLTKGVYIAELQANGYLKYRTKLIKE